MGMRFGQRASRLINFLINDVMPPVLRDSWLMKPLFWLAFGRDKSRLFLRFRDQVDTMTPAEIARVYRETAACDLKKDADISPALLQRVAVECGPGQRVVDVGCGRGRLAVALAGQGLSVVGVDLGRRCPAGLEGRYAVARTESLPLADACADVVVCAHVLEHIPDIFSALSELRRISRGKVIVVLPVERPYRFGFNLHVWFFPYRLSVLQVLRPGDGTRWQLERHGNEWLYIEACG
jgi:ubiquinone/menaquinone biosynthesis C-methylase UbiE